MSKPQQTCRNKAQHFKTVIQEQRPTLQPCTGSTDHGPSARDQLCDHIFHTRVGAGRIADLLDLDQSTRGRNVFDCLRPTFRGVSWDLQLLGRHVVQALDRVKDRSSCSSVHQRTLESNGLSKLDRSLHGTSWAPLKASLPKSTCVKL